MILASRLAEPSKIYISQVESSVMWKKLPISIILALSLIIVGCLFNYYLVFAIEHLSCDSVLMCF